MEQQKDESIAYWIFQIQRLCGILHQGTYQHENNTIPITTDERECISHMLFQMVQSLNTLLLGDLAPQILQGRGKDTASDHLGESPSSPRTDQDLSPSPSYSSLISSSASSSSLKQHIHQLCELPRTTSGDDDPDNTNNNYNYNRQNNNNNIQNSNVSTPISSPTIGIGNSSGFRRRRDSVDASSSSSDMENSLHSLSHQDSGVEDEDGVKSRTMRTRRNRKNRQDSIESVDNDSATFSQIFSRNRRDRPCKKGFKILPNMQCVWCATIQSPEWRKGPDNVVLCNACGIQYKKHLKREQQQQLMENKNKIDSPIPPTSYHHLLNAIAEESSSIDSKSPRFTIASILN